MMKTRALAATFLSLLVCFIVVRVALRARDITLASPNLDPSLDGEGGGKYQIGSIYKHITGAGVFNVLRSDPNPNPSTPGLRVVPLEAASGDGGSGSPLQIDLRVNTLPLNHDSSIKFKTLMEKKQRLVSELSVINTQIEFLSKNPSDASVGHSSLPPSVTSPPAAAQQQQTISTTMTTPSNFIAKLKGAGQRVKDEDNSDNNSSGNSNSGKLRTSSSLNSHSIDSKQTETLPISYVSPSKSPGSVSTCKYKVKVYVYEIPDDLLSVKLGNEARRNNSLHVCHKCILEQFSLEYIMNDFFTQFCGRTYDPQEADFFYLPLVRDAEYRVSLSDHKNKRNRAPSLAEQALIALLDNEDSSIWKSVFKVTDVYWRRHRGADHIIVMPAPVTNLRHESSKRGFFHYMVHLHDPIWVGVEYSKSFVDEYPICSVKKNIVVPYPTTDVEFFNGKLLEGNTPRESLLYYAGGMHGDCIEVRTAMKQVVVNSTKLNMNIIPHIPSNQEQREHGFRASIFCPIPVGDSPSSKRMYDVINFGCIPVVLSDDLIWAFSDQSAGPFSHSLFALHLPQGVVQHSSPFLLDTYRDKPAALGATLSGKLIYNLLEDGFKTDGEYINGVYVNPLVHILRRIPNEDIANYQIGGRRVAPFYRFYAMNSSMKGIPTASYTFPGGNAMDVMLDHLAKRKVEGVAKVANECREEKSKKHKYVHRYPCDNSIARRRRLIVDQLMHPRDGEASNFNTTSQFIYRHAQRLEMIGYNPCNID